MIFLPTELVCQIIDYLTNKQDQLVLQYVCRAWHIPAKSAFYKNVVIVGFDNNKTYKFVKFIQSMASAKTTSNSLIPPPGPFVKALHVDFGIIFEIRFMPTVADYQLLGISCPNVEEFGFPVSMFWNYLISANMNQYWKKIKRLPSFGVSQDMGRFQLGRIAHFRSSLTHLDIDYSYKNHFAFSQMIKLFTNLKGLKIRTHSCNLTQMMPTLIDCPNITEFSMTTTTSANDMPVNHHVPKLRHLDLNVCVISSHLINAITQNFPDLQRLVLRVQRQSPVSLNTLSRFITTALSQSSIDLFLPSNDSFSLIRQYISSDTIVNISYDSRSSFTTGVPDLSYHQHDQHKRLFIRFQGSIPSNVQSQDFSHMRLLKENGTYIHHLKIQSPSPLLTIERKSAKNQTCIQSLLMNDCPNLSTLLISQSYFDLNQWSGRNRTLSRLTLEKCVITAGSLYQLSLNCAYLKHLTLEDCELDGLINMPKTEFKKLSIVRKCDTSDVVEINLLGPTINTMAYYLCKTREIVSDHHSQPKTFSIKVTCQAMDQFRFNYIPVSL